MNELRKAKGIRYAIVMIILVIALMALLLAMSNYAEIREYKEILQISTPKEYYESINNRENTKIIVIRDNE